MDLKLNDVFLGDNLEYLSEIKDNTINLIYIDPPFYTGVDYKEFLDIWNTLDDYLKFMKLRIKEIHRTLKDSGSFYCHCDANAVFDLKPLCDNIFGRKNFRREIIWNVGSISGFKSQRNGWIRQHDNILYYTKSNNFTFNKIFLPYSNKYISKYKTDENGKKYTIRRKEKQYLDNMKGIPIGTIWNDILSFQSRSNSKEYLRYPTQKPEKLLKRIILASSNEKDLVADFFCGSGTTLYVAKKLNRNYIGCDTNPNAIKITENRLKQINRTQSGVLGWL